MKLRKFRLWDASGNIEVIAAASAEVKREKKGLSVTLGKKTYRGIVAMLEVDKDTPVGVGEAIEDDDE